MIGYNSHEGLLRLANYSTNFEKEHDENFELIVQKILRLSPEVSEKFAPALREEYFGKDPITVENLDKLVDFFGDILFAINILLVCFKQAEKTTPTYAYRFSYRPDFPTMKNMFKVKIDGTLHFYS